MQSGTPLSFWAIHDDKADLNFYVRELSRRVGCDEPVMGKLVECLREISWLSLLMHSHEVWNFCVIKALTLACYNY